MRVAPPSFRQIGASAARMATLALALLLPALAGPGTGGPRMFELPRAFAHAAYDRSQPAFAEELSQSPVRLDLWFNQELFRQEGANTITLHDQDGRAWPTSELVLDRDDRRHVYAALTDVLPPGRYLLAWSNLSADDGDDDAGRSVFYVGRSATAAETEEDRALAADLLIPYPGDIDAEDSAQASATPAPPAPPRPVAFDAEESDGGIDGTVIGFGVVSLIAIVGLIATRARSDHTRSGGAA